MLVNEAIVLNDYLLRYVPENGLVVNIGSATMDFRHLTQPYIQRIFSNLEKRGGSVIHVDLKSAAGVDMVGDITDEEFALGIKSLEPKVIFCSNVLEHVEDRSRFIKALSGIVADDGFLVISVPHKFPHHPDPIDNGYRPTLKQLAKDLDGFTMLEGEVVRCGPYPTCMLEPRVRRLYRFVKFIVRIFTPFYKADSYLSSLKDWFFYTSATCAVFSARGNH